MMWSQFQGNPKSLRAQMEAEGIAVAPGCYDALSAQILEKVGFKTIYLTGHGVSVSLIGKSDVGLTTMSEVVTVTKNVTNAVDVPVIVDIDTGYGNPLNVQRTVREIEHAGAAGIQIEDQEWPKKCGHMAGKRVISKENMIQKIRAAVDAKVNKDLVIIARTDVLAVAGMDEAIERGNAYIENGADVCFIDGIESMEQLTRQASEIQGNVLANMVEGGKTPYLTAAELQEIGYKIVIYPLSMMYALSYRIFEFAEILKSEGSLKRVFDQMIKFDEFNELMNLKQVYEFEKKYEVQ